VTPRYTAEVLRPVALVAVVALGCTPTERPADARPSYVEANPGADRAAAPRLDLGLMYWALPQYVLGDTHALVFGAELVSTRQHAAERPELRGPTIFEATLRVERVLHQSAPPDAKDRVPMLDPGELVTTDAAEGVAVGDLVLVFATAYEGSYAILPKRDTTTDLGIVVTSWSDPIVAATERWLAGKADFRSEADASAWRPYGEAAVRCMLEGIPVGHCDAD
jgi:hypothetical protein